MAIGFNSKLFGVLVKSKHCLKSRGPDSSCTLWSRVADSKKHYTTRGELRKAFFRLFKRVHQTAAEARVKLKTLHIDSF